MTKIIANPNQNRSQISKSLSFKHHYEILTTNNRFLSTVVVLSANLLFHNLALWINQNKAYLG